MGKVFIVLGEIIGGLTWLATVFLVFVDYGFWWGLLALVFPPADLIFMFLVGTWIPGLVAIGLYVFGAALLKD